MARQFTAASSHYLEHAAALITDYPWSACGWFYCDTDTANQVIFGISDTASNEDFWLLVASGSGANNVEVQSAVPGTIRVAATTTTFAAGAWYHAACSCASATSRAVFLNGGGKGTSAISNLPTGLDTTSIGRWSSSVPAQYMDGRLAEIALWNIDLTDAEVAILALGISPLLVRPGSLISYWPLLGRFSPEIDIVSGFDMTVTSATAGNHTRMVYPAPPLLGIESAVTAAVGSGLVESVLLARRGLVI